MWISKKHVSINAYIHIRTYIYMYEGGTFMYYVAICFSLYMENVLKN